ncbi:hypothetical protein RHSIM_Rhsim05G0055800 [Rhododendron simsii]|uniref:Aminotransferase-like plant mobile domain-containing protein n=1 Tax=Rhododendron simsii TaxID=118357 RepID=A0A834GV71_RHOSS|nr:hypothetical protein RHSIM_Rhsim05G0055800 [Rhododendron simsii]
MIDRHWIAFFVALSLLVGAFDASAGDFDRIYRDCKVARAALPSCSAYSGEGDSEIQNRVEKRTESEIQKRKIQKTIEKRIETTIEEDDQEKPIKGSTLVDCKHNRRRLRSDTSRIKREAIQEGKAIQNEDLRKTIENLIKRKPLVHCKHNDPVQNTVMCPYLKLARKDLHSNTKRPAEASDSQEYDSSLDTPGLIKTPTTQAHVYELRERRGTQQGTIVEAQANQPKLVPSITIQIPEKSRARGATQSQYELRARSEKQLAANIEEEGLISRSQPVKKRSRIEAEKESTQQRVSLNRSNLQGFIRLLKDTELSPNHIACFKKTPFWLLIESILDKKLVSEHCRKFDEVVVKVVKSYDERTKSFRLGDKKVKLKDNHVKLIFGICCGNEEMTERNISKGDTALAKRLCIKEPRLTTTTIKEKIKELKGSKKREHIEDVVRLFCLFLCVTLLFSTSGTTVNWSLVYYMEDLAKVKQYNWAGAVTDYLMKSIHKNHKELNELHGCSLLLMFWLCEQINLLQQKNADAVPRLLKWNISELRDVLRDFDQLSQLPADQVSTKLQETEKERKIYSNLGSEQEGGEIEALELEVEKVRMSVDGESSQQAEVYREERVEKGATQVKQAEIEKEQRSEVLLCGEQAENYGTQRGESARGECAGVGFMAEQGNGQGLDDFNTPSNPSFEVDSPRYKSTMVHDSIGLESQIDSGSTLVPNTYNEMSLDNICGTILDQSKKDAIAVIDELNKKIELLEKEKKGMENEMLKVQEEKEKALQHQKEEIEFLKWELEEKDLYISKLCKKNEVLEKLYKQYEEDVQHYETHELTQGYNVETERQVHQVTQKATFDTIKELREERDQLEGELINIKVHEVTQQARAEKVLEKSKKKSPPSKFKRVKERDDRKTNFDENYVYGKLKRKSPQIEFVDVDDFQETSLPIQVQNPKKKLKNLKKCNTEISKLIRTETWLAIEQLWKAGNLSAVIWSSEADMLHIEVEDIQNLLFEDATSNRCVDAYVNVLMKHHSDVVPKFDLNTPIPKSFIFSSFFLDTIRNRDKDKVKAMLGKVMRKSVGARFLLFPILVQFHWTLLVLDKDEGYWKFYNSIKRRSGKDEHCAATILLITSWNSTEDSVNCSCLSYFMVCLKGAFGFSFGAM